MQAVAAAFAYLAYLLGLNGRRLVQARLRSRYRIAVADPTKMSRFVKIAPRAERRARQGRDFIPVYFFEGPKSMPNQRVRHGIRYTCILSRLWIV